MPTAKLTTTDPDRERFELALISAQSRLSAPYPLTADGDKQMLTDHWRNMVLQWVLKKKWFSKLKVGCPYPDGRPYPRAWVRGTEPKGELAYRELELCIQLHSSAVPYSDAVHWFEALNSSGIDVPWQSKGQVIAFEKWVLGRLRSYQNPITQQALEERLGIPVNPAVIAPTHLLYDWALDRADSSDRFRCQFWRPYLTAYSQWIKAMEGEDYALLFKHRDRLWLTGSNGRDRMALPQGY